MSQFDTLVKIYDRFNLPVDEQRGMPIEIPNIGRDGFASVLAELGFNKGAEIGVEQGVYSETLCKANPDLHLICVDAWKAYRGYRDHTTQEKLDRFYQTTLDRLKPYNCTIIRKFSMDALAEVPDRSLDFVYIDANHDLKNCVQDIHEWSKKVKIGGIIAGHDYAEQKKPSNMHVYEALQAYTRAYAIRPWFVLGTKAIVEGVIRDEARSWFFVNQEHPFRGNHRD